ncbi:spindle and kinetochore-associated protein 3-like [Montipora foliosa]|uniref:spindle and kinetochore-associated protein 3-like n=1 Tax=Montipora foliosa TaxID=591990 RepID=UPI0035F11389
MTSCQDFFNRLRKLAVTVDKESNELKGLLENSGVSAYNESRACLLLRETLAEVKDCQREVSTKLEDIQHRTLFGDFISACGRLTRQTKQHIDELENHLEKYGYIKPKEKLPDLSLPSPKPAQTILPDQQDIAMETSTTELTSSTEKSDISDREVIQLGNNPDIQPEIPMEKIHTECSDMKENLQDVLKSPVPPATFTKLIEVTPQRPLGTTQKELQEKGQLTPCLTPEVPQTTTPMIKSRQAKEATDTPTQDSLTQQPTNLPQQPLTATPMIKADGKTHSVKNLPVSPETPPLPALPIISTPGLKPLAPFGVDSPSKPESPLCLDSLPSPPDITSVQILKPDDITLPPVSQQDIDTRQLFVKLLNQQEYGTLPVYVASQFSLDSINQLLTTLNTFLLSNTEGHVKPTMLEQDLRNLLGLGAATKAFMLALAKTGRLKLAEKSIIFITSG